jgi:hypothetical protein
MDEILIPNIYDLYNFNNFNRKKIHELDLVPNFIRMIKITIINSDINIMILSENKEKHINLSDNILKFDDILINYCDSYIPPIHMFFRVSNNKNNHSLIFNKISKYYIYDNLLVNDALLTYYTLEFNKNVDDTILIYFSEIIYHLPSYIHLMDFNENIEIHNYCKYITIIFDEICDYNYTMNNILDIKINNIDVKFKCIFENLNSNNSDFTMALHLIFVSINNINLSYISSRNCIACKIYNKFTNFTIFNKLIKYDKNNYDGKLNQIMPNILDCDKHRDFNIKIFAYVQDYFAIKIADILSKLNLSTTQKIFRIRYNYI